MRAFSSRSSLFLLAVLVVSLIGPLGVSPAHAATCSTVNSCEKGSSKAADAATEAMKAEFETLVYWVEYYIEQLVDTVTRMSNANTQDAQSQMTTLNNQVDAQNVPTINTKLAETRAAMVKQYVPSVSTCAAVTRNFALSDKEFNPVQYARYNSSQKAANDFTNNDPATPSGKGAVAASAFMFTETLKGFCNPAALGISAGPACTTVNDRAGKPMEFRFAKPYQAIFAQKTIPESTTDPENRAARLFAQLVTEPVPADPVRNAALTRPDGRSLSLQRLGDVAAVNLARGVIDRMIDERLVANSSDKSLHQVRLEVWDNADRAQREAIVRANGGEATNAREIEPLILDQNRIYMQIMINLERLAAIKAAHLARSIKQNAASGSSTSSSGLSGN